MEYIYIYMGHLGNLNGIRRKSMGIMANIWGIHKQSVGNVSGICKKYILKI